MCHAADTQNVTELGLKLSRAERRYVTDSAVGASHIEEPDCDRNLSKDVTFQLPARDKL